MIHLEISLERCRRKLFPTDLPAPVVAQTLYIPSRQRRERPPAAQFKKIAESAEHAIERKLYDAGRSEIR